MGKNSMPLHKYSQDISVFLGKFLIKKYHEKFAKTYEKYKMLTPNSFQLIVQLFYFNLSRHLPIFVFTFCIKKLLDLFTQITYTRNQALWAWF